MLCLEVLDKRQSIHALTTLTRLAKRKPESVDKLRAALQCDLPGLAPAALTVARETGDPIGSVLADLLKQAGEIPVELLSLADELPDKSIALQELAYVL